MKTLTTTLAAAALALGLAGSAVAHEMKDDEHMDHAGHHPVPAATSQTDTPATRAFRDVDAEMAYDGCFSPITFATVHDCTSTTDQTTYKASVDVASGTITSSIGLSNIDVGRDEFQEQFLRSGLPIRVEEQLLHLGLDDDIHCCL